MIPPSPNDPFISPAWRHQRATYLVAAGRQADHPRDDDMSQRAWRYLLALSMCGDEVQRQELARETPDLDGAYAFYSVADPLKKAELEARLLAGQDDIEIAPKTGLTAEVVAVYSHVFYCVRPRLQAELYIISVIFDGQIHRLLTEEDRGLILKLVGFCLGPVALNDILAYFNDPPQIPADLGRLGRAEMTTLYHRLNAKALVASLALTGDRMRLRELAALQDLREQLYAALQRPAETSLALQLPAEIGVIGATELGKPQADVGASSATPAETPNEVVNESNGGRPGAAA